jgi:hypothetical protein
MLPNGNLGVPPGGRGRWWFQPPRRRTGGHPQAPSDNRATMTQPTSGASAQHTPDTLIATRESRLALWQAEHVRDLLGARFGLRVGLLGMTTRGDQILDRALQGGRQGPVRQGTGSGARRRPRPPGRALAEGRADGPARRLRAGRGAGARRPARRLRLQPLRQRGRSAAGRGGGHQQPAPGGAAAEPAARPAHRAAARQPRHPAAQAGRRRLRRHRAGRRRPEAPGPGRAHPRCSTRWR